MPSLKEGPLSAFTHVLLLLWVLLNFYRSPLVLGPLIMLEFSFSQAVTKVSCRA